MKRFVSGFLLCLPAAIPIFAQSLTPLGSFSGANGALPSAALIQAADGYLYGTSFGGGSTGYGAIFRIAPDGKLSILYSFCSLGGYCTDGANPYAALVQAPNGEFYGTTQYGGVYCGGLGCGTIFKISPGGALTTIFHFCAASAFCASGSNPVAALVIGADGNFYGTTVNGGSTGYGTVFRMTPGGVLTTLHSFDLGDGAFPYGALVQAANGDFYGTTNRGGASGNGTIFKIAPGGTLTTMLSFNGADGAYPYAGLIEAANGSFYGTTYGGGAVNYGTVFKIAPNGTLTTLHSFAGMDGESPYAGLLQASDEELYGTTQYGGANNGGTVFKITPTGAMTVLYSFCSEAGCTDGEAPVAGIMQASSGILYGVTQYGGTSANCPPAGCGTIFSLQ